MRLLLTGGAGFIGSHVATALTAAGHDVSVVDNFHPAAHRVRPEPGDPTVGAVHIGDVRDPDTVAAALRGVDAVVHHAAMVGMGVDLADLPEYVSCNDLGTAVLLAGMAQAGVRRLVLASSMVVYGEGSYTCPRHGAAEPAPRRSADLTAGKFEPTCVHCGSTLAPGLVPETTPLSPRSGYAASKVAQEYLAGVWARETESVAIALRYHNVYGPGMPRDTPYAGVAAIFRSSVESGQPPQVFEDGGQLRDFIHVTDVARANVAALSMLAGPIPAGGSSRARAGLSAYNVASGEPHTVADLATALAGGHGGLVPVITGQFRAGDVRHIVAAPDQAAADLGFRARIGFREGIAEFATATLRS